MKLEGITALVTGGASGLGRATAEKLIAGGANVVIVDLPTSDGANTAKELGPRAQFAAGDVTSEADMQAAMDLANASNNLRAVVHCAGRGGALRILDKAGNPGALDHYEMVVRINLIGTFNVLRLAAAAMAKNEPVGEERGVVVNTASVAGYEGQIGQIPYASAKAGIIGMTIVAARDLANRGIRVNTIAPGIFDTPLLGRLPEPVRQSLGASVPFPQRLGTPQEFALLASHIIENPMLNGETIRLDGAIRMAPR
ncbi:SDR family NAD(P)-dependent oxidoreductase [Camelimonas lactis]|uniref:NAD(P)-dependent dehydrogenase (Short-subunit alcohol dehydrogenase family) n=1 Tax=Camelimonas lactis TaxID=659006 RepID=A0A4R2GQY3_9HYPH|nr:SDR family NAD(P)-dependent oxidoreductase [Camelimonas lactis]TCO12018.1 NAD(P)-dependent dehydrogenase (short-subunit alcohol dehydrogenase family) [Camelimonas lactis]